MEIILTKMFQIITIFDEQILYILLQNVSLSEKKCLSTIKNQSSWRIENYFTKKLHRSISKIHHQIQ